MGKLIDLATRRRAPESPKLAKAASEAAAFVNREPVNPPAPEKPHPVHQAARALALSRMATAGLSRCQRREALLKTASMLATCPRMRQVWRDKADQVALSIRAPFAPLADGEVWVGFDPASPGGDRTVAVAFAPKTKQIALWPWLLAGLSFALAIVVTPPFWVS